CGEEANSESPADRSVDFFGRHSGHREKLRGERLRLVSHDHGENVSRIQSLIPHEFDEARNLLLARVAVRREESDNRVAFPDGLRGQPVALEADLIEFPYLIAYGQPGVHATSLHLLDETGVFTESFDDADREEEVEDDADREK